MSTLALPGEWDGNLDELVGAANRLLPQILPLDKSGRAKEGVNARLVRHYTTERLLDEPLKQGREARYTRRHLLQLLALRKLMASGYGAAALRDLLGQQGDDALAVLITGEAQLDLQAGNPALDSLRRLRGGGSQPSPLEVPVPAPASALPTPEVYTCLTLAPGLELHVRAGARLPGSRLEQERLARAFLDALDRLRSQR